MKLFGEVSTTWKRKSRGFGIDIVDLDTRLIETIATELHKSGVEVTLEGPSGSITVTGKLRSRFIAAVLHQYIVLARLHSLGRKPKARRRR